MKKGPVTIVFAFIVGILNGSLFGLLHDRTSRATVGSVRVINLPALHISGE